MHQQSNATPASNLPAVIPPEATGALYKDSEPTLPGVEPPHHPPITLSALAAKVNPPIKRHHLSAMFGDMAAQDFGDFCAGIAGNPGEVVLYDGKVVDGYHRYVAEYAAGIPSTFLTLAEWAAQHHVPVPDVLDFVVDRNKLRRRHDDLMVGVELKHAYSERAEARKLAGVKAEGEKGRASDLAAAQLGNKVSPDTIDRADKLLTENPDIKEELKQGTTTWKKARATAKTRRGDKKKKLVNTPAPEQTSEPQTVSDFNPDGDGLVDRFETQEEVAKRQTEAQKKSDEELEKKKGAARQLIVDAVKEFAVRPNHIWSELGTEEWDGKRLIVPLLSARWSAMDGADDIIALEARTLRSDQKLIVKKDGGVNNTFWIAGRELKALVEAIEQDQKPKHEADPDGEAA